MKRNRTFLFITVLTVLMFAGLAFISGCSSGDTGGGGTTGNSGGTISGIVSDNTDNPVNGAKVYVVVSSESAKVTEIIITDNTDVNGKFTLSDVPPGTYTLTVEITGYDTFTQSVTVGSSSAEVEVNVQLTLAEGYGSIKGKVTNSATETALAGVTVALGDYSATTGSDGTFMINGLEAGSYTIKGTKTNFGAYSDTVQILADRMIEKNFSMTAATGSLSGTVTRNGSVVEGATVTIGSLSTTTASDGTYLINDISPGTGMTVTTVLPGGITGTHTVDVAVDEITERNFTWSWNKSIVDQGTNVGLYTSIDSDSEGNFHISYQDGGNGYLKYAYWNGSGWNVSIPDSSGNTGLTTSIKIDRDDQPGIAYCNTSDDVRYTRWSSTTGWTSQTITGDGVNSVLALVDSTNIYPFVCYFSTGLSLIESKNAKTSITVDIGPGVSQAPSAALDSSNFEHYAFYNTGEGKLKYFERPGSSVVDAADATADTSDYCSIALDSTETASISYVDKQGSGKHYLKYAWQDSSVWTTVTVDTTGDTGYNNSLKMNSSDNPSICYYEGDNMDLHYAWYDGTQWNTESIDSYGDVGKYCSMALDLTGAPAISYHDVNNGYLKFIRLELED